MNDECPTCGAPLLDRKTGARLNLARHAEHASKRAFDKDGEASKAGRRDAPLLAHARRLKWSRTAEGIGAVK